MDAVTLAPLQNTPGQWPAGFGPTDPYLAAAEIRDGETLYQPGERVDTSKWSAFTILSHVLSHRLGHAANWKPGKPTEAPAPTAPVKGKHLDKITPEALCADCGDAYADHAPGGGKCTVECAVECAGFRFPVTAEEVAAVSAAPKAKAGKAASRGTKQAKEVPKRRPPQPATGRPRTSRTR